MQARRLDGGLGWGAGGHQHQRTAVVQAKSRARMLYYFVVVQRGINRDLRTAWTLRDGSATATSLSCAGEVRG